MSVYEIGLGSFTLRVTSDLREVLTLEILSYLNAAEKHQTRIEVRRAGVSICDIDYRYRGPRAYFNLQVGDSVIEARSIMQYLADEIESLLPLLAWLKNAQALGYETPHIGDARSAKDWVEALAAGNGPRLLAQLRQTRRQSCWLTLQPDLKTLK